MINTLLKYWTALMLFSATGAFAGQQPFSQLQFDKALAQGTPTIVYFHADWCPTCRVQQPIVNRLAADPGMRNITVFVADFDHETALRKALRVTQQSTFVVFKGGREVARATGQTSERDIRDTWEKAR